MRCLERNKQTFYYSLYDGKLPIVDDYGNLTGEYEVIHGLPMKYRGNISAAKGETQSRQFGEDMNYDKVIVLDNTAPNIDEYSVLWIDTLPTLKPDGSTDTPYDYIVKKVARSLNSVSIAISKVNVNVG